MLLGLHVEAADGLLELAGELFPHCQELGLPVFYCEVELLLSHIELLLRFEVEKHLVDLELLLLGHHGLEVALIVSDARGVSR